MIYNFKNYDVVEVINSGASSVEKYKLIKDNMYYLLRIYDARFMSSRYIALENMNLLYKNNVRVPKVYDKGLIDNEKGFALVEWIAGLSLENKLLTIDDEISYGKASADELKKMHTIKNDLKQPEYERFLTKFQNRITKLSNLNIKINQIKILENYVKNNISILKELNGSAIIHGDFHPGNIIVDKGNNIVFIDMDVCKIAHPWHDLSSNACNMEYPNFYSSVITNYFNGYIPEEFWKVYNVFGCYYVIDYLLYCIRNKEKTIADGEKKLLEYVEYTNGFQMEIPSWFNKKIKVRRK